MKINMGSKMKKKSGLMINIKKTKRVDSKERKLIEVKRLITGRKAITSLIVKDKVISRTATLKQWLL